MSEVKVGEVRYPDKPIRMGWTVCKISDQGTYGGYFVCDHVVKVGKKSYVYPKNGKNYDIVDQLTAGLKDSGRLIVMDSGFPNLKLTKDSWQLWRTRMIATRRGNTAHMPRNHKVHFKKAKKFVRGFSKALHHDNITVTYWNDNNVVTFLDNGIPSGREHWDTMEVNQGVDRETIHVPKVAELYKGIYGWVDRGNQQLSYHNTEFRSVRKQNRVLDSLTEMYVLVNGHTLWRNSPDLMCNVTRENMSQSEFRFAVIRVWYAMFRKTNGRMEVLHYPVKRTHHWRSLAMTVTSPRKGTHNIKEFPRKIVQAKIKCRICGKKTLFKCSKCSSPGDPLVICCPDTGRQCWNQYHITREYDLPSSQSQEET